MPDEKNKNKSTLENRVAAAKELRGINDPVVSGLNYAPGIMEDMNNAVFRSMGMGSFTNQMQDFCFNIDRFSQNVLPGNRECVGLTFITRPKLNLSGPSLLMDRTFARLDTKDVNSVGFMARHLLDTKLCKDNPKPVSDSGLVEAKNPFMVPLMNGLLGISGFPDETIQTTNTEGGYFNEDQTFVQGGDSLRKSYDLTLNFKDIQYSPISTIIETWSKWMTLAMEGRVVAYGEDINRIRIPYTCSIYRFVLDPSKRFIMRCAKATGCFPQIGVSGASFNINEGVNFVDNSAKFSVPFKANHVMYNDYVIYILFNLLVQKYSGVGNLAALPNLPDDASSNYSGIPYIEGKVGSARLVFKDIYSGDGKTSPAMQRTVGQMVSPLTTTLMNKLLNAKVAAGHLQPEDATAIRISHSGKYDKSQVKRKNLQKKSTVKRMGEKNIVGGQYV